MESIALKKDYLLGRIDTFFTLLMASWALAALAQIRIDVPFSPVPFTGQVLGVGLLGAILGPKRGFAAVALYLVEGALGFPFFSGFHSGIAYLAGPVGGYLMSFPFLAYLAGVIQQKQKTMFAKTALLFAASQITLAIGSLWLSLFVGLKSAFLVGWLPFIPFDLIKCYGIAKIGAWLRKI